MSMMVARMEKMKSGNLGGLQRHNQREFENHSNKEIDKSRSHLNYDLVNDKSINYQRKVMRVIDEQRESTRAIRKDAVLVNEWVITSDHDFFEKMEQYDKEKYFKVATQWFQKRYGEQNVAYAQVHLDETTPHMHLGVVPMKDGKLQSKNIFNRKELLVIQEELPKYLQKHGFKIERGEEGSKRKNMRTEEFKQNQKEMESMLQKKQEAEQEALLLEKENNSLESNLKRNKGIVEQAMLKEQPEMVKTNAKHKGNGESLYAMTETNAMKVKQIMESVTMVAMDNAVLEREKKELLEENKRLKERVGVLERAQEQMSSILKMARKQLNGTGQEIADRVITFAKSFYDHDKETEQSRKKMLEHIPDSELGREDKERWKQQERQYQRRR